MPIDLITSIRQQDSFKGGDSAPSSVLHVLFPNSLFYLIHTHTHTSSSAHWVVTWALCNLWWPLIWCASQWFLSNWFEDVRRLKIWNWSSVTQYGLFRLVDVFYFMLLYFIIFQLYICFIIINIFILFVFIDWLWLIISSLLTLCCSLLAHWLWLLLLPPCGGFW